MFGLLCVSHQATGWVSQEHLANKTILGIHDERPSEISDRTWFFGRQFDQSIGPSHRVLKDPTLNFTNSHGLDEPNRRNG